jgi:hypothetical protein
MDNSKINDEILNKQWLEFLDSTGDISSKLLKLGYLFTEPPSSHNNSINSFDLFKDLILSKEVISKNSLKSQLKMIYKNELILKEDLNKLLKSGKDCFNFSKEVVNEIKMILPLREDKSIRVEELVEFLYR